MKRVPLGYIYLVVASFFLRSSHRKPIFDETNPTNNRECNVLYTIVLYVLTLARLININNMANTIITTTTTKMTASTSQAGGRAIRRSQSEYNLFANETDAAELSGGFKAVEKALVRSTSFIVDGHNHEWKMWKEQNQRLDVDAADTDSKPTSK